MYQYVLTYMYLSYAVQNKVDMLQDKVVTVQDKVINLEDKLDTFQNTTEANTGKGLVKVCCWIHTTVAGSCIHQQSMNSSPFSSSMRCCSGLPSNLLNPITRMKTCKEPAETKSQLSDEGVKCGQMGSPGMMLVVHQLTLK